MIRPSSGWALAAVLVAMPATAQAPDVTGQWECEYATRNIYRTDAHAAYFIALFNINPNGTFEAQGHVGSAGPFQAQGQWRLEQEANGLWFTARGQQTNPQMGVTGFGFDSFVTGPSTMALNEQYDTGDQIASQCRRRG